jgi:hypothetical protein
MMRFLDIAEEDDFHKLAAACGFVFGCREWLQVTGGQPCGLFDAGGKMVGGAVLSLSRVAGAVVVRTPTFTPCIGPFLRIEASHPVKVRDTRRRALMELSSFLKTLHPAVQSIALDRGFQDVLPFVWAGYKATPAYTYLLNLEAGEDQLFAGFSSKRRSELRKAEKDGLVVHETRDLGVVLRLVDLTYARQGKSYPKKQLQQLLKALESLENWYAILAEGPGGPVSAAFCLHSADTAYYLFGGYDASQRNAQAGAATLWQAIRSANARGLRLFDFEGSSIPAIERFYSDFGGELLPFFRITRAWMPLEFALKLVRRSTF